MYRHRLRGPGGNRVAITGHAGLTGSIQNLFVKALGAVTSAMAAISVASRLTGPPSSGLPL